MKKLNFLLLACLTFSLFACGEKEDGSVEAIMPLHQNNVWKYSSNTAAGEAVLQYPNRYTIAGCSGFTGQTYSPAKPLVLLSVDGEGNLKNSLIENGNLVFSSVVYIKSAKTGDTWKFKTAVFTNDDDTQCEVKEFEMRCSVTDTVINTPVGAFTCTGYSYTVNEGEDIFIDYFAVGIGRVYSVHHEVGYGSFWALLKEYSVK